MVLEAPLVVVVLLAVLPVVEVPLAVVLEVPLVVVPVALLVVVAVLLAVVAVLLPLLLLLVDLLVVVVPLVVDLLLDPLDLPLDVPPPLRAPSVSPFTPTSLKRATSSPSAKVTRSLSSRRTETGGRVFSMVVRVSFLPTTFRFVFSLFFSFLFFSLGLDRVLTIEPFVLFSSMQEL